jgi:hypothetical protein
MVVLKVSWCGITFVPLERIVSNFPSLTYGFLGCAVTPSAMVCTWGDDSVSSCRSSSRATGPGTSAGAFPMELSLSKEGPRGPRRGAKGSCGTPGTP